MKFDSSLHSACACLHAFAIVLSLFFQSQFASASERLHNIDVEVEEARHKRDWAIGEYNKALTERDQLRKEMDCLRLEKDQAIEDRVKVCVNCSSAFLLSCQSLLLASL